MPKCYLPSLSVAVLNVTGSGAGTTTLLIVQVSMRTIYGSDTTHLILLKTPLHNQRPIFCLEHQL